MAPKTRLAFFALAAALSAGAAQATTITGAILFGDGSAITGQNGYVVAELIVPGFANAGAATATVGPGVEFALAEKVDPSIEQDPGISVGGLSGFENADLADFSMSGLIVTSEVGFNEALPWDQTFTANSSDYFSDLKLVSSSYEGLTYSATGDALTLHWAGFLVPNQKETFAADFSFGAGAGSVPEPADWALMILGFGLSGCALRRQTPTRVASAEPALLHNQGPSA